MKKVLLKMLINSLLVNTLVFQFLFTHKAEASFFNFSSSKNLIKFLAQKTTNGVLVSVQGAKSIPKILIESSSVESLKAFNPIKFSKEEVLSWTKSQWTRSSTKQLINDASTYKSDLVSSSKALGFSAVKEVTIDKLKHFPKEAIVFFIGLGALNFLEMLADPSSDPLKYHHYIDSQTNPVGAVGFLNFMIANGVGNKFLMEPIVAEMQRQQLEARLKADGRSIDTKLKYKYIKAFSALIPQMGMTLGSIASNVVHEIFGPYHEEAKCAVNKVLTQEQRDECIKRLWSFSHLAHAFSFEKVLSWSPSISSMIVSNIFSAVFTSLFNYSINLSLYTLEALEAIALRSIYKESVIKFVGLAGHVATAYFGGTAFRGLKFLITVASTVYNNPLTQIATFTFFDKLVHGLFEIPFTNFYKSHVHHTELDNKIKNNLLDLRKVDWNPDLNHLGSKIQLTELNKHSRQNQITLYIPNLRIEGDKNIKKNNYENSATSWDQVLDSVDQRFSEWRQYQMQEILAAHASWTEMINTYVATYRATESFYKYFMLGYFDRHSNKGQNRQKGDYKSYEFVYPMSGVFVQNTETGEPELPTANDQLTQPFIIMKKQREHVAKVIEIAEQLMLKLEKDLGPNEKENIEEIISKIKKVNNPESKNLTEELYVDVVGGKLQPHYQSFVEGIQDLNGLNILFQQYSDAQSINRISSSEFEKIRNKYIKTKFTEKGKRFLAAFRQILGNPEPILTLGQGFSYFYSEDPAFQDYVKVGFEKVKESMFWCKSSNNVHRNCAQVPNMNFSNLGELMSLGFVAGPDVDLGQSLIQKSSGFPVYFNPPKIDQSIDQSYNFLTSNTDFLSPFEIIFKPDNKQDLTYNSVYQYIAQEDSRNIKEHLIGDKVSNFEKYWAEKIESQYVETFSDYEDMYQTIVSRLIAKINNEEPQSLPAKNILSRMSNFWKSEVDDRFKYAFMNDQSDIKSNKGLIANDYFTSIWQQRKIYMLYLSEMIRHLEKSNKKDKTNTDFIKNKKIKSVNKKLQDNNQSILAKLRFTNVLDLEIMNTEGSEAYSYNFVYKLTSIFNKLDNVIKSIEVKNKNTTNKEGFFLTETGIDMETLQTRNKAVDAYLNELGKSLNQSFELNSIQKIIAERLIKGLKTTASEVHEIAMIAIAVSKSKQDLLEKEAQKEHMKLKHQIKPESTGHNGF
jgi:hypothetical protein